MTSQKWRGLMSESSASSLAASSPKIKVDFHANMVSPMLTKAHTHTHKTRVSVDLVVAILLTMKWQDPHVTNIKWRPLHVLQATYFQL
jgi:hypothetical protein